MYISVDEPGVCARGFYPYIPAVLAQCTARSRSLLNHKAKEQWESTSWGATLSHPTPWCWSSDQILLKTWKVREAQGNWVTELWKHL